MTIASFDPMVWYVLIISTTWGDNQAHQYFRVSRTSLALSIARVLPSQNPFYRVTVVLACTFLAFGIGFLVAVAVQCGADRSWHRNPPFGCVPRQHVAVVDLIGQSTTPWTIML